MIARPLGPGRPSAPYARAIAELDPTERTPWYGKDGASGGEGVDADIVNWRTAR